MIDHCRCYWTVFIAKAQHKSFQQLLLTQPVFWIWLVGSEQGRERAIKEIYCVYLTRITGMVFILDGCKFYYAHICKSGILIWWRHLVASKEWSIPIFFSDNMFLQHACATCSEQPSNIKTMMLHDVLRGKELEFPVPWGKITAQEWGDCKVSYLVLSVRKLYRETILLQGLFCMGGPRKRLQPMITVCFTCFCGCFDKINCVMDRTKMAHHYQKRYDWTDPWHYSIDRSGHRNFKKRLR